MGKEIQKIGGLKDVLATVDAIGVGLSSTTKKDLTESWDDISAERVNHVMTKYSEAISKQVNPTFSGPIEKGDDEVGIAKEAIALREIEAMVERRKAFLKARTYATVDRANADRPEVTEGILPVESTKGKVQIVTDDSVVELARGGGGRDDASVDMSALEALLGTETFRELACEKVHHKREVIKAHDEFIPSEAALEQALIAGRLTLEQVRQCVQPGRLKPTRFTISVKTSER